MSTISHNLRKAAQMQLAGREAEIVGLAIERATGGDSACIAALVGLMTAVVEQPTKTPCNAPASNPQ